MESIANLSFEQKKEIVRSLLLEGSTCTSRHHSLESISVQEHSKIISDSSCQVDLNEKYSTLLKKEESKIIRNQEEEKEFDSDLNTLRELEKLSQSSECENQTYSLSTIFCFYILLFLACYVLYQYFLWSRSKRSKIPILMSDW